MQSKLSFGAGSKSALRKPDPEELKHESPAKSKSPTKNKTPVKKPPTPLPTRSSARNSGRATPIKPVQVETK